MKFKTLALLGLATCLITLGLASSASAASKWCITLPNGQVICLPLLVEEIRIPVPPPVQDITAIDIRELSLALTEVLGPEPQPWIFRDALGERAIMMDFETGQAFEMPQEAGR